MDYVPLAERGQVPLMASGRNTAFIGFYHFALIWKGFLLRKRHYIVTFLELLIPILIASIPVIIHAETQKYAKLENNFVGSHEPRGFRYQRATYYKPFDPQRSAETYYNKAVCIIFTPNSDVSANLTDRAVKLWQEKFHLRIKSITGVATEADLEDEALKIQFNGGDYPDFVLIGLVYSNFPRDGGSLPRSLHYKIYYGDRYRNFNTKSKYPPFRIGPPYSDSG